VAATELRPIFLADPGEFQFLFAVGHGQYFREKRFCGQRQRAAPKPSSTGCYLNALLGYDAQVLAGQPEARTAVLENRHD
jgi:hypothetical protein